MKGGLDDGRAHLGIRGAEPEGTNVSPEYRCGGLMLSRSRIAKTRAGSGVLFAKRKPTGILKVFVVG